MTTFKAEKPLFGILGDSVEKQKKRYDRDRAHARDMEKTGRGKAWRYNTFTDKKTGQTVPDTERNRKRYKDRVVKSPEKITKIWKKGKPTYKAKGGRAGYNIGGRANLLEEMGRIDARRHPDAADRAEKHRVIGELNKGYKSGGAVLKGKKVGCQIK